MAAATPSTNVLPAGDGRHQTHRSESKAVMATSKWSELPDDLLCLIVEKVMKDYISDLVTFSSVCKSWRSCSLSRQGRSLAAVTSEHLLPKLILPKRLQGAPEERSFIHWSTGQDFRLHWPQLSGMQCRGSGHGWLVMVDEANRVICLVNYITRQQVPLPVPRLLYNNHLSPADRFVRMAVIAGDPSFCEDYSVAAIIYGFIHLVKRPHDAHAKWELVDSLAGGVTQIAASQHILYTITYALNKVAAYSLKNDVQELWTIAITRNPIPRTIHRNFIPFKTYSFLAFGRLYGVSRTVQPDGSPVPILRSLVVFRLNHCRRKWEEVKDLGECCLFLSDFSSMALAPVPKESGFRRNCVYFTYSFDMHKETQNYDLGVYSLDDGTYQRYSFANAAAYPPSLLLWVTFNRTRAAYLD